jgi:hypothetical protein
MKKKSVVVVSVFLAGLLGGATAAVAFPKPSPAPEAAPCAVDMCRDQYGRCVMCPDW